MEKVCAKVHNTVAHPQYMLSFLKILGVFALAGGIQLVGQTEQPPGSCDSSALEKAQELQKQKTPNTGARILELYQAALPCTAPQPPNERAEILLEMGKIQARLDRMEEAQASFSSARDLFQRVGTPTTETRQHEAAAIVNLAFALQSLGRVDEALRQYDQALELFHSLDERVGEAYTLGELGRTTYLMGDNEAALSYYKRALAVHDNVDPRDPKFEQNQRLKAAALDVMGRINARMGQTGLAQSNYRDALALARSLNYHRFIAYTLNDMGILLLKDNKPQLAEQNHLEARAELEKYEPEDNNGMAETRALLGDAQMALGKTALAHENYRAALSLQQQSKDVIGEAETRYSLGLLESSSNPQGARLESLKRAAELYHRVHHREGESQSRFQIAKLLSSRGDREGARIQVEFAIQLGEEVRAFTPGRAQRIGYFASVEKMYRFEIALLLNSGVTASQSDQLLTLELMQKAQARSLVDALELRANAEPGLAAGDSAQRRDSLLHELKKQNAKLQWLLQSEVKPQMLDAAFNSVQRVEASLDEIEAEARSRNPALGFFSGEVSVPEIQQRMLDQESILIQFCLAEPSSHAWVITESAVHLVNLPPRPELEQKVQEILHFGGSGAWTDRQKIALRDFRRQLAPLFTITRARRWIIVPDGLLHDFPFALLSRSFSGGPDQGPQEVVKIPSLAAIDIVRGQPHRDQPAYTLAIFADPVFNRLDSRVRANSTGSPSPSAASSAADTQRGISFARLLYSRKEMQLISRVVPASQAKSFVDFAADAAAASGDALKNFKIIHFATHSVADGGHPELSRIVFSLVSRDGRPKNPGYLMLKDIYRMQLASDLVVLSSCRGASGQQQAGEGPMSLSRAFLFAGSKAVVAPLWEVDDEATAKLMGRFYRYLLKDHLPPISALKRAQDDFRHHPDARLHNPYYWAGFELYGDWVQQ